MPSRQSTNFAVEREWLWHAAEQVKPDKPGRFRVSGNAAACLQRLDLRGEAETPAIICGVKRFDAVGITRKE